MCRIKSSEPNHSRERMGRWQLNTKAFATRADSRVSRYRRQVRRLRPAQGLNNSPGVKPNITLNAAINADVES